MIALHPGGPCEISLICTGLSTGVATVQVLFRQPYCQGFVVATRIEGTAQALKTNTHISKHVLCFCAVSLFSPQALNNVDSSNSMTRGEKLYLQKALPSCFSEPITNP